MDRTRDRIFGGAHRRHFGWIAAASILLATACQEPASGAPDASALSLAQAAAQSNSDEVKRNLEHGIDPNGPGLREQSSLLTWAAAVSDAAIVSELIRHGADVNRVDGGAGDNAPSLTGS